MQSKTLKKIKKMKKNDEISFIINEEKYDLICIEKQQYLLFTPDTFYEISYEELTKKINEIQDSKGYNRKHKNI